MEWLAQVDLDYLKDAIVMMDGADDGDPMGDKNH